MKQKLHYARICIVFQSKYTYNTTNPAPAYKCGPGNNLPARAYYKMIMTRGKEKHDSME